MDTATQQKSRLFKVATIAVGVFVHLLVCWAVLSAGLLDIAPMLFMALAAVAATGFAIVFLAIMMEWNLGLEDPDMSLVYMMWAMTIVIMTTWFAAEMKPLVALSGLALIVVGANRLTRVELVVFAAYGLTMYLSAILYQLQFGTLSWMNEVLALTAFALVLVFGPILYRVEMSMFEAVLVDKNQELTTALGEIKRLAVYDELTGAYNRRHLMDVLNHQKAMADRRADYNFSLCYVDLDYLKRVNERFGHGPGDRVLVNFARMANELLRDVDCVARIGGEEFVMVLGGTPEKEASVAAKRLAEGLADLRVSEIEPNYRITASIGIAEYRPSEEIESLVDRADRALYDAKRMGRNRIVVADSHATQGAGQI